MYWQTSFSFKLSSEWITCFFGSLASLNTVVNLCPLLWNCLFFFFLLKDVKYYLECFTVYLKGFWKVMIYLVNIWPSFLSPLIDWPVNVPLFSLCQLRLDVTFLECFPGDENLHVDFSVIFDPNIHFPGFRMEEVKFMPCFSPGVYFQVLVLKL